MTTALTEAPENKGPPSTAPRKTPLAGPRLFRAPWFILLSLTLFGGVLRFSFLNRPPIWGDEAMTFARVCGSYQDLIDVLQFNGFVPLHYEVYWWISKGMPTSFRIEQQPVKPIQTSRLGHVAYKSATTRQTETKQSLVPGRPIVKGGITMTPFVMRIVPALAGTLMIPAMYFLARQIASRKTALVAALITCCSAYLLNYSRDAKMYMDLWLFCTLNVACLLWWLRVRTRIAWLCWVATGLAMCGLHAPGMILLAIELIVFLCLGRQWWPTALVLLGGFVLSGMLVGKSTIFSFAYDAKFNILVFALAIGILTYIARRGRHDWAPSAFFLLGLAVILAGPLGYYSFFNQYVDRLDDFGWQESGLQWVDKYNEGRSGPEQLRFVLTAFLTSWEWPKPVDERYIDIRAMRFVRGSIYVISALLVLGLIPWRRIHARRSPVKLAWLLVWIAGPAYAIYCYSNAQAPKKRSDAPSFESPLQWFVLSEKFRHEYGSQIAVVLALLVLLLAVWFMLSGRTWRQRVNHSVAALLAAACVFALCVGIYFHLRGANLKAIADKVQWHSIWMPRYLGIVWPAVAIVVSVLLLRLPTRAFRAAAIAFFVAVNLALFGGRVFASSEPPVDRIALDVWKSQPKDGTFRAYTNCTDWFGMAPGMGAMFSPPWRYYMVIYSGIVTTPAELRSFRNDFDRTRFYTFTDIRPFAIASDLGKNPKIDRIVVWDRIELYRTDAYADDPLKSRLAQNWRKVDEQVYTARDHWTWQALFKCRRREYVRTFAP